jgi:hypothetical protein
LLASSSKKNSTLSALMATTILQFPQFSKGVAVVSGDPGHGRAAQIHALMVGPDALLVAFGEDAMGARAPGLDSAIAL